MHGRLAIQVASGVAEGAGERFRVLRTDSRYFDALHSRERVEVGATHEAQPNDPYFHDSIVIVAVVATSSIRASAVLCATNAAHRYLETE